MYICSSGIISKRPKQYRLAVLVFCPEHNYPSKHDHCRFHTTGGKSGGGKAQWKSISGWYYQLCAEVAEKTGVWRVHLNANTRFTFLPAPTNPLLLITSACLGPNGAVPHTHAHGLIANPCKGQLLLCAEPAVTRRVRRLQQTAAVTMINHLALSFTCRWTPHLGPLKAKIKYLCCLLELLESISSQQSVCAQGPGVEGLPELEKAPLLKHSHPLFLHRMLFPALYFPRVKKNAQPFSTQINILFVFVFFFFFKPNGDISMSFEA